MEHIKSSNNMPLAPISWGELVDKITILEIKLSKIDDQSAQIRIKDELLLLSTLIQEKLSANNSLEILKEQLKEINLALWAIEDSKRAKENEGKFDEEFIKFARLSYHTNDKRSAKKREIDALLNSRIVEQKKYSAYQGKF